MILHGCCSLAQPASAMFGGAMALRARARTLPALFWSGDDDDAAVQLLFVCLFACLLVCSGARAAVGSFLLETYEYYVAPHLQERGTASGLALPRCPKMSK